MEKRISKIIILTIIFIAALFMVSIKSYASGSFKLYFPGDLKAEPGETIEVPLYLDSVNIEGVEKKMISFRGTVDFDSTAFELVPYTAGDASSVLSINDGLERYGLDVSYNADNNHVNGLLEPSALRTVTNTENGTEYEYDFVNELIEVGKVKVKVKSGIEGGDYRFTISDAEGVSGEFEVVGINTNSTIHVALSNTGNKNEIADESSANRPETQLNSDTRTPKLTIEVSKDGKRITITPDEVNGAVIEAIKYKNTVLAKENGSFIFDSEPNKLYEFFIYGLGGKCFGNEYVTTVVNEEAKTEENKDSKNETKSPQTGDYIAYTVAALQVAVLAVCVIEMTRRLRKVK